MLEGDKWVPFALSFKLYVLRGKYHLFIYVPTEFALRIVDFHCQGITLVQRRYLLFLSIQNVKLFPPVNSIGNHVFPLSCSCLFLLPLDFTLYS